MMTNHKRALLLFTQYINLVKTLDTVIQHYLHQLPYFYIKNIMLVICYNQRLVEAKNAMCENLILNI